MKMPVHIIRERQRREEERRRREEESRRLPQDAPDGPAGRRNRKVEIPPSGEGRKKIVVIEF